MGDLLTVQDLEAAKKHDTFHSEVISGKAGGVAGGASIDYATNAVTGQTQKTLPRTLLDIAFVRTGTFAAGATLTDMRQTLEYGGLEYSWSGSFPKVVPAASTPATTGGIGAGAWVDRSGDTLKQDLEKSSGISLVATNKFAVYVHSAPDDGVTDATQYFSDAASTSAQNGYIDIIVKKPATTYLLSSDPVISKKINVIASPDWFSGAGAMPIHNFQSLTEGVDPRDLRLGISSLIGTDDPQTKRLWAIQGAVDITQSPVTNGTESDSVGVSGRGYARAPEARVWGGVSLAYLGNQTTGGGASAIGHEIDVNNEKGSVGQLDGGTRIKGLLIVSGGTYRPEEARLVFATKPNDANGDNRFYVGDRFAGNSFLRAAQWFDDEVEAPAQSMGYKTRTELRSSAGEIGWSNAQNRTTKAIQSKSMSSSGGFEYLSSDGSKQLLTFNDYYFTTTVPVGLKTIDTTISGGINASLADIFNVTDSGTISGGIAGGANGQTIKIANFSSGTVIISRNSLMRTPSSAAVSIPQLAVACFSMQGGVWLLNYVSQANV